MLTTTPSTYDNGYTILEQLLLLKKRVDEGLTPAPTPTDANLKVKDVEIGEFAAGAQIDFGDTSGVDIAAWLQEQLDGESWKTYDFGQQFEVAGVLYDTIQFDEESIVYAGYDSGLTVWSTGSWNYGDLVYRKLNFKNSLRPQDVAMFEPVATIHQEKQAGVKIDAAVLSADLLQHLVNAAKTLTFTAYASGTEMKFRFGETWREWIERTGGNGDAYIGDGDYVFYQGWTLSLNGVQQTADMPLVNNADYTT